MRYRVHNRAWSSLAAAAAFLGVFAGAFRAGAEPVCLVNLGTSIFRINGDGAGGIEQYVMPTMTLVAMTQVPPGVTMNGAGPGDIIATDPASPNRLFRVTNARSGSPGLVQIGTLAVNSVSIGFANGQFFAIDGGGVLKRFDTTTYTQIGADVDVSPSSINNFGGIAFDGSQTWFLVSSSPNSLFRFASPAAPNSVTLVGNIASDIGACGLEFYEGQPWMGTKFGGNLVIGRWNRFTGSFTPRWQFATMAGGNCGFVAFDGGFASCDSVDFNNNDVFPEDQDIIDFFNVLAGGECSTCNDPDFNNNGVFPEDADIIDFFNVLAGGSCP